MSQTSQSAARRPLRGRRIVVTRARAQAADLVRALTDLGADVVAAPTIRVEPLAHLEPLRLALADLPRYAWIVFTSQNAVQIVCDHLPAWGLAPRDLARARVAAIGPATAAALSRHGVTAELVPHEFVAEAVVQAIAAQGELRGKRILLPRAREARDALPEGLRAHGATVDVIPIYETVLESGDGDWGAGEGGEGGEGWGGRGGLAAQILAGKVDAVTFTSSSTVRRFAELVGREAAASGRFAAAVIGPVTAATARELGVGGGVTIEADEYTVPGLIRALVRHFGGGGAGGGGGGEGGGGAEGGAGQARRE